VDRQRVPRRAQGDLWQTGAALAADDARPEVHLVARRISREELLAQSGGTPGPWSPRAVRLAEGDPGSVGAVKHGSAGRAGRGQPAHGARPRRRAARRARTGCGSTCAPARAARPPCWTSSRRSGARGCSPSRRSTTARGWSGAAARDVVTTDSRTPPLAPGTADRVLLDAPCSGLGRAAPPARGALAPAAVRPPAAHPLQGELLDAAAALLRPGGVLAYVTCSPHLAETVVPVLDVLRRHPELEQVDARPLLPGRAPTSGRAGRAAVAAPARHRRDVPRAPAPSPLTHPAPPPSDPHRSTPGLPSGPTPRGASRVRRAQISPSILSADFAGWPTSWPASTDAADWAHVDVMDNHFVPNLTLGLPVVEAVLKSSRCRSTAT
jgi:16S rRNA (cytosine967-C5)-methyltransferase